MATQPPQPVKKARRMLFNKSGMAYILKPATEGGQKRVFHVGTAIDPLDEKEEKFLLDYHGIVYADTIMPATNTSAELAEARKKVAELTAENEELKAKLEKK